MTSIGFRSSCLIVALGMAWPALACNPKTGKQCSTDVGSKAELGAKKARSSLLGNGRAAGAALGVTLPLGQADALAAPPADTNAAAGGTPDGWWYLPPGTTNHGRPTSYATLLTTQNNMQAHGQRRTLVNPDGSLSPTMLASGWIRLAPVKPMAVPNQAPPIAVPTPQPVVAPRFVGTPDGWWYIPPGGTNHGQPTRYQTLATTQENMRAHGRHETLVNPDGSLSATMLARGWIRLAPVQPLAVPEHVAVIAPPTPYTVDAPQRLPQPMLVPGQRPPDQVPVAQPMAVPALVAQPMQVPGQRPPGQVPVAQPIAVPALVAQPMQVPGQQPPGQVPVAQPIAVPPLVAQPMQVPGQQPPGQVPVAQPVAVPALVAQPMQVPGQRPPDQVPVAQPVAVPALVAQPMQVPGQRPPDQVPVAQPVAVPALVAQPMQVPGQRPPDQVPVAQPVAVPPLVAQPMQVPGQQPPAQVPVAQPVAVPALVAQPMQVPGQRPPDQVPVAQPVVVPPRTVSSGSVVAGPAGTLPTTTTKAHPERTVHVYHGTDGSVYRYDDAMQVWNATFHLVVIGFKEP